MIFMFSSIQLAYIQFFCFYNIVQSTNNHYKSQIITEENPTVQSSVAFDKLMVNNLLTVRDIRTILSS